MLGHNLMQIAVGSNSSDQNREHMPRLYSRFSRFFPRSSKFNGSQRKLIESDKTVGAMKLPQCRFQSEPPQEVNNEYKRGPRLFLFGTVEMIENMEHLVFCGNTNLSITIIFINLRFMLYILPKGIYIGSH